MNNIDITSLKIDKIIRSHILCKDYTRIDLVGVFFHEIMIYATNYYIIKTSKESYEQKIKFPFLNTDYIEKMPQIDFYKVNQKNKNIKYKIAEFIQYFLPISKSIAIEDNVAIDLKKFIISNFLKYKFSSSLNTKIFVENYDEQISNLKNTLEQIAILLEIKKKDNFILNFIQYVNLYISCKPVLPQADILITGSNAKLTSRINGANYLFYEKKVISFCHGEYSSFVLDEPIVAYAELSYCSNYVTYGNNQDFVRLDYATPLFDLPKIHYRSSDFIRKYYVSDKDIKNQKILAGSKILYIPTLFSGNQRYGPFRDIEDEVYKQWQKSIMSLGYNITYKTHPKNKIDLDLDLDYNKVATKNLKDIMFDYDFYILDYISTASALCVATDKPIIYFNIGMRNLQKEAKTFFQERTYWVDIDMSKDFISQIQQAIEDFNKLEITFINECTHRYSINDTSKSEVEILKDIINKGL